MELDIKTIKSIFDKYNTLIFENQFNCKLPTPTFAISKTKKCLGIFKCVKIDYDGHSYKISISNNFEHTIKTLTNVVVHEMIHYIQFNCMHDNNSHGFIFCKYMNAINRKFNELNITIVSNNEAKYICKKTPVVLFTNECGQRCFAKLSNSSYYCMINLIKKYFGKYGSIDEAICEPCSRASYLQKSVSTLHYLNVKYELFTHINKNIDKIAV